MSIRCEQAVELFDAYLDGELAPSLAVELDAHRLQCTDCRRRFALLEVTEHLITSDREPVQLKADFADRLVACMESAPHDVGPRVRRWLYVAAPLAAAAVFALALLGLFDQRGIGLRAGVTVEMDEVDVLAVPEMELAPVGGAPPSTADVAWQAWYTQLRGRLEAKRRTVESFHQAFDLILFSTPDWPENVNAAQEEDGANPSQSRTLDDDAGDEGLDDDEAADEEEVEDL